ncbi:hypothetical protein [Myxococcus phage Mx1]|nr:hypothetical protein [Myxococcus phage Mx1]
MPLYYFKCETCGAELKKLLSPAQAEEFTKLFGCSACLGKLDRDPRAPSSQAMEKFDNGFMARPVERLADAERIFTERAAQHSLQTRDDIDQEA